jgi:hypothetical protein
MPLAAALEPTGADRAAPFLAPAESLPEQELQRPPPHTTAEPHHRQPLYPNQARKPIPGESHTLSLDFPTLERWRVARILVEVAALHGQGPHCKVLSHSGCFVRTEGISVRSKRFQGLVCERNSYIVNALCRIKENP